MAQDVNEVWLRGELGSLLVDDQVEAPEGQAGAVDLYDMLSKAAPFVALVRNGAFERVVDRRELALQVARSVVRDHLKT